MVDIGTLTGTLEIDDRSLTDLPRRAADAFNKVEDSLGKLGDAFEELSSGSTSFGGAMTAALGTIAAAAAVAVAAVGGISAAIIKMGVEGSKVTDIEDGFARLTKMIGVDTHTAITNLQEGVGGLMGKMELMQPANIALSAGLKLNSEQFKLVGQAARALAEDTGKSLPEAYEAVMGALTAGRVRSLQSAGAFIEVKGASDELKNALKEQGDAVSTGAELEAKRGAVLEALGGVVTRHGKIEDDFADSITRGQVAVKEWYLELQKAIGASPVLNAALSGMGKALAEAFGPHAQGLIDGLVHAAETFVFALIEWGKTGLTVADVLARSWALIKTGILAVTTIIFGAVTGVVDIFSTFVEYAARAAAAVTGIIPGADKVSESFKGMAEVWKGARETMNTMTAGLAAQTDETSKAILGQTEFSKSLDTVRGHLDNIENAMIVAGSANQALKKDTDATTGSHQALGDAAENLVGQLLDAKSAAEQLAPALQENVAAGVQLGLSVEDIAKKLHVNQDAVQQYVNLLKDWGENNKKLNETMHALHVQTLEESKKWQDEINKNAQEGAERRNKQTVEEWNTYLNTTETNQKTSRQLGMNWLQMKLDDEKDSYDKSVKGLDTSVALQRNEFVALTVAHSNAINTINRQWDEMNRAAAEAANSFGNVFRKTLEDIPNVVKAAFTGGGGMGGAMSGMLSELGAGLMGKASTDLFNKVGGGLAEHLGLGLTSSIGALVPGLGSAIGSLIGPLASKLWHSLSGGPSEAELQGRQLAENFRKGLDKALTESEKSEAIASGNEKWASSVIGLRDQYMKLGLSAADALTDMDRLWKAEKEGPAAVQTVIADITNKMDAMKKQQEDAKQFVSELGKLLGDVTASGHLASQQLLDMVLSLDGVKGATEEVNKFITQGAESGITGLTNFLKVGADAYKGVQDKAKEYAQLQQDLAHAQGDQANDIRAHMAEVAKDLQINVDIVKGAFIDTQASAEAFGAALAGAFGELQSRGMSITEALKLIEPGVTALQTQLEAMGLSGGDAFTQLLGFVDMAKDAVSGPMLDAVSALNQGFVGLHNSGLLTQDIFAGLSGQVTETYDKLIAQGKDGDSALRLMSPTLQTIWELQQDFGYAVDDSTQKLLDQGVQAGVVGEQHRTAQDKMAQGIARLVVLMEAFVKSLGVDVPAAASTAGDNVSHAMEESQRATALAQKAAEDYAAQLADPTAAADFAGNVTYAAGAVAAALADPSGTDAFANNVTAASSSALGDLGIVGGAIAAVQQQASLPVTMPVNVDITGLPSGFNWNFGSISSKGGDGGGGYLTPDEARAKGTMWTPPNPNDYSDSEAKKHIPSFTDADILHFNDWMTDDQKAANHLPGFATGGFIKPFTTMMGMLHGGPMGEIIAPVDQFLAAMASSRSDPTSTLDSASAAAMASRDGGGTTQTIVVQVDGQVIARAAARNLPRVLALHGVA